MLAVHLVQHDTLLHVYVVRWTRGARYPERVLDLDLTNEPQARGRDTLRAGLRAVLDALDARSGEDPPDAPRS